MTQSDPSFNLWSEPWITLEKKDGSLIRLGIKQALVRANKFCSIYDPSPLVVVGIYRLLTAILQDIFDPQNPRDLQQLWKRDNFSEAKINTFGQEYANRFDIFSEDAPFLQSADISCEPPNRGTKTVTYLMPQIPAGSAVTHYRHGMEDENCLCPACVAQGLLTFPAFATSGGAGIKPSINGVPPIYILPGGKNLYEILIASLVLPQYQPKVASTTKDSVWWKREPIVERKAIAHDVGYLHSLIFPARRVRLFPERINDTCSKCGQKIEWGVSTMIYKMGESRPKDAPFWFDPFVAYYIRDKKGPVPLRPQEGKAIWREFASLFLPCPGDESEEYTKPPSVLYQLAECNLGNVDIYPFRCIGMRTDMRMKVFEWLDVGFDVPTSLLHDYEGSDEVRLAIDFANGCAGIISHTFQKCLGGEGKDEHHKSLRHRMIDDFWTALAHPFRDFVLAAAEPNTRASARLRWIDRVVAEGKEAFKTYSNMIGSNASSLRKRVIGRRNCNIRLYKKRKEQIPDE